MRTAAAMAMLLLAVAPSAALALEVPALTGHVNDYAHVLPAERASALEAKLAAYEQRTGQQFALLTVESLEGDAIESFSIRVAERWKLGNKQRDDGLVLVVVPKERKLRIEVGYGLEGNVPDAIAARVIREIIAPAFQRGDFPGGIEAAFDALTRAASGQGLPQAAPRQDEPVRELERSPLSLLGPLIFFVLLWLMTGRGRRRGGMFWLGPLISAGMGGGSFGGGRRGGGGGGFRGGGGGFGGGGASGGW